MPTGSCLCGKFKYEFTGEPQGKVRVSFPTKAIDNIPPFAHERVSTGTDERANRHKDVAIKIVQYQTRSIQSWDRDVHQRCRIRIRNDMPSVARTKILEDARCARGSPEMMEEEKG
jgi:hypothetical protein